MEWLRGSEGPVSQGSGPTEEPYGFNGPWMEGEGVYRPVWE